MASPKSMPKDAQMIAQLLEDMGIIEYEPRAIYQTLKFAFRYVTTVLDNAKIYSSHVRQTLLMQMCNWQYSVMMTNLFNSLPLQDYFAKQRNDDRDKL